MSASGESGPENNIKAVANASSYKIFSQKAQDMLQEYDHVPDQLLVTFRTGITRKQAGKMLASQELDCQDSILVDGHRVALISLDEVTGESTAIAAAHAAAAPKTAWITAAAAAPEAVFSHTATATSAADNALAEAMEALAAEPGVEAVQPNYRYHICGQTQDPFLDKNSHSGQYQYHLEAIHAEEAWELVEQKADHVRTLVGVVDEGLDPKHEDLQANRQKTKEGGDGYVLIRNGKPEKSIDDPGGLEGHGTHVTGIIDATYGNGKGGSGVASGHQNDLVRVLTVGASENGEDFTSLDLVQAVRYAADQDVRVINMSVTGYERDRLWERSIKEAFYEKGILFVAASGNGDVDMQTTPSDLREVIAVNASNADNTALYWSDYGWRKEITAPGNSILSTLPGDRYGLMSGTSMASPVVAGVAALMLDVRPEMTPDQVRNILCATTSQQGRFVPETTAYGIVDAQKAVQAALDADTSVPVESLNLKVNKGKPIELNAGDDTGLMALSLPAESLAQISWSSSDPDVVEVDQYGNLLAKAEGEATITVSSGERKDTCAVRVHPSVPATELTIGGAPEDGQLEVGEEATLEWNIAPEDVTNREVIWSSDNSDVIVCFDEGLVRALAPGKATITAETFDGKLKATITLVVKPMATRLQFTRTIPWMFVGEKGMFAGRLLNKSGKADVAHREIIWSSSNRRIAQVDRKTGRVSALRTGKFFVKARNHDETAVATRQVIVAKKRYAGKADYALCQSAKSRKSVTIRWKKIPVAAGYQIQQKVKTGRKTWKWKNVRSVKGSVCTAQFRGKGQKTFRVRAYYRKSGKTRYFGWSNQVPTKPGKTRKADKP